MNAHGKKDAQARAIAEAGRRVKALAALGAKAAAVAAALEEWISALDDLGDIGNDDDVYEADTLLSEIGQVFQRLNRPTKAAKAARKNDAILILKRLANQGLVSQDLVNAVDGLLDVISDWLYDESAHSFDEARDTLVEELRGFQKEVKSALDKDATGA